MYIQSDELDSSAKNTTPGSEHPAHSSVRPSLFSGNPGKIWMFIIFILFLSARNNAVILSDCRSLWSPGKSLWCPSALPLSFLLNHIQSMILSWARGYKHMTDVENRCTPWGHQRSARPIGYIVPSTIWRLNRSIFVCTGNSFRDGKFPSWRDFLPAEICFSNVRYSNNCPWQQMIQSVACRALINGSRVLPNPSATIRNIFMRLFIW